MTEPIVTAAAIRLAITMSVIAAAVAVLLHTLGVTAQAPIVLGVIVVAFTTSWVRSGRSTGRSHRRVVTVPVRGVHFPVS